MPYAINYTLIVYFWHILFSLEIIRKLHFANLIVCKVQKMQVCTTQLGDGMALLTVRATITELVVSQVSDVHAEFGTCIAI